MKPIKIITLTALLLTPLASALTAETLLQKTTADIDKTIAQGPCKPNWESLKTHTDPEWFRDAKFGIYTHWGP